MMGLSLSSKLDCGPYIISNAKTVAKKVVPLICSMKVPGSNPIRRSPGLRTQPHYRAPGDFRVEYEKKQKRIN